MAKQLLRDFDLTTLLVALDHVEEFGPATTVPDPLSNLNDCIYLTYLGETQAAALAARLPHIRVKFKVPGGAGRSQIIRKLFSRPSIMHVLRFVFGDNDDFIPFLRSLDTVDKKYWKVLPLEEVSP